MSLTPINHWEKLEVGDRVVELRDTSARVRTVCAVSSDGHWIHIEKFYGVSKSELAHAPSSQERVTATGLSRELRSDTLRAIESACSGDLAESERHLENAERRFKSLAVAIRACLGAHVERARPPA